MLGICNRLINDGYSLIVTDSVEYFNFKAVSPVKQNRMVLIEENDSVITGVTSLNGIDLLNITYSDGHHTGSHLVRSYYKTRYALVSASRRLRE